MVVDRVRERARTAARRAPGPTDLSRLALGAMVLLAGVHKLVAPDAWAIYVVDWLAPWIVLSPVTFMLVNGVLEVAFGVALLADRQTAVAAGVAAVSLTATVGYLAAVWTLSGRFGDVLVRDVGLAGLAWAVVVDAVRGW
jgi:uncharacterized membrane protein YphA (DoxX/SURF4 family)